MKETFTITLIVLFLIILVGVTIPIKEVWLDDSVIYGDYFCYTYDGSCVSTGGHATAETLTIYELIKYNGFWRDKNY